MRCTIFWGQSVSHISPYRRFTVTLTNDQLLARDANAGGYCYRGEDANGEPTRTVWFSDEFTPRYEWTWGGGNFLGSAAIRYHCWQRCACAQNPTKGNLTSSLFGTPVMRLSTDFWIEESVRDGSMTLNMGRDRTAPHHQDQVWGFFRPRMSQEIASTLTDHRQVHVVRIEDSSVPWSGRKRSVKSLRPQ